MSKETRDQFISLTEATRGTPYSQEYLSLLARTHKLSARKFGRNWYTTKAAVHEYTKRRSDNLFTTLEKKGGIFEHWENIPINNSEKKELTVSQFEKFANDLIGKVREEISATLSRTMNTHHTHASSRRSEQVVAKISTGKPVARLAAQPAPQKKRTKIYAYIFLPIITLLFLTGAAIFCARSRTTMVCAPIVYAPALHAKTSLLHFIEVSKSEAGHVTSALLALFEKKYFYKSKHIPVR